MIKQEKLGKFIVYKDSSIKEALKVIDNNKEGIAFVVNKKMVLLGTMTDGDIRRFILRNGNIASECEKVMNTYYIYTKQDSEEAAQKLMVKHKVRQVPLLDNKRKLTKVFVSVRNYESNNRIAAVIIAGGEGKRLSEISMGTPKPLVKIKETPILGEIIFALKKYNINQIFIALNYKADLFKKHFKDGSRFGVKIEYLEEKKRLGTAGPLSLLPKNPSFNTLLVINADILTNINFDSLIRYHRDHHFFMSIAAKEYAFDIPYGVLEVVNGQLIDIKEKPSQRFFCNAAIYVLEKGALAYIPKNRRFDMTNLIRILMDKSLPMGVFPIYEYWIDIGNANDYKTATKEYDTVFKRANYE